MENLIVETGILETFLTSYYYFHVLLVITAVLCLTYYHWLISTFNIYDLCININVLIWIVFIFWLLFSLLFVYLLFSTFCCFMLYVFTVSLLDLFCCILSNVIWVCLLCVVFVVMCFIVFKVNYYKCKCFVFYFCFIWLCVLCINYCLYVNLL